MTDPLEQATGIPTLSKNQIAALKQSGPFRVYQIVSMKARKCKKKGIGLKLIDPKVQGLLHEVADALLQKREAEGGEYVIEDPRTTKILWTTAGSTAEARQ